MTLTAAQLTFTLAHEYAIHSDAPRIHAMRGELVQTILEAPDAPSVASLARIVGVGRPTIYRWLDAFLDVGDRELTAEEREAIANRIRQEGMTLP